MKRRRRNKGEEECRGMWLRVVLCLCTNRHAYRHPDVSLCTWWCLPRQQAPLGCCSVIRLQQAFLSHWDRSPRAHMRLLEPLPLPPRHGGQGGTQVSPTGGVGAGIVPALWWRQQQGDGGLVSLSTRLVKHGADDAEWAKMVISPHELGWTWAAARGGHSTGSQGPPLFYFLLCF